LAVDTELDLLSLMPIEKFTQRHGQHSACPACAQGSDQL
jgi:hypothetical protein